MRSPRPDGSLERQRDADGRRAIEAEEALLTGLATRVFRAADLERETMSFPQRLGELSQPKPRSQLYESVETLQADLDASLHHYNHERPHLGYRNQGRRPWETIELFVSQSPGRQGG